MKLRRETDKKTATTKWLVIAAATLAALACVALVVAGITKTAPAPVEPAPAPPAAPEATSEPVGNALLAAAREKNPDVVGWLTLLGAGIDDPVVQAADNDFYLRRRWDEAGYDVWGCYFLDYINVTDGHTLFDRVSIIYGHALDDAAESEKFSKLKRYDSAEFCKANPDFTFELLGNKLTFEVFSVCKIPVRLGGAGYDYIDPNPDDAKLQETLDYMLANSVYDFGVEAGLEDTFLFLSTCTSDENVRYVVAGKLA